MDAGISETLPVATIVDQLGLSGNPFEHYTAETEPHITEYAVRPPYLEAIAARVIGLSSFILFGDRGAGKSATRITVFNQVWAPEQNTERPLVANLTDFSAILPALKRGALADKDLVEAAAFVVVEQVLLWLSALDDGQQETILGRLDADQKRLAHVLVTEFYLSRPEFERQFRTQQAFTILRSALTARGAAWVSQRWDAVAAVVASIAATLSKKVVDDNGLGQATEGLLKSLRGDQPHVGRAVLMRLVSFAQSFGFTGVSILIDKVDETDLTTNSAESTTKLIYPLLSHIQLLEVTGFSWQFFLWGKVKSFFGEDAYHVRLDKIANSSISWDGNSFRNMLDARLKYFSRERYDFSSMFVDPGVAQNAFEQINEIAMGSPRELVKIMDVIIREHDAVNAANRSTLLDEGSVNAGLDKYVRDVINTVFNEKSLGQIYRLKSIKFINKDVQGAFRVGDQSARAKIKAWEDAGLVKFIGTRAAEGDFGGKPANEYMIADARIERIMARNLVKVEELDEGD